MKIVSQMLQTLALVLSALFILPAVELTSAHADSLRKPAGPILLTITGAIAHKNSPNGAEFDYEMLQELGLVEQQIDTPWTDASSVFEGVLTRKLMQVIGAAGDWVTATAINDYRIVIPMSDLTDYDTMLGLSQNGKRMQVRDKGPLWILYNNDNQPPIEQSQLNKRMIWQLTSLSIH